MARRNGRRDANGPVPGALPPGGSPGRGRGLDIVIDDDRLERLLPLSTAHFGHRVFLGYRLSTRLVEGMTALWPDAGPGWAVVPGAGTCALFDVAFAAGLRRRGRTLFRSVSSWTSWTWSSGP